MPDTWIALDARARRVSWILAGIFTFVFAAR
jgi:hypothetical protein